ncbi:MAG: hypothetical protein QMB98_01945 [Flaviflexus sp.]|uniref:hypothetical protein n=1 Tax=Flaviflexus sp. TaxID=1969482 RepID=UPI00352D9343
MSIKVGAGKFTTVTEPFGSGTLIGQHPDEYIRIFTVDPVFDKDGTAHIHGLYGSVVGALKNSPQVTIIWQPRVDHGWTLIYDGVVNADSPRLQEGAGDDDELVISYLSGMLHRPSAHRDGPEWSWPDEA